MRIGIAALGRVSEDTGGKNYIEHFFRTLATLPSKHSFVLFLSGGEKEKLSLPNDLRLTITELLNTSSSSFRKVIGEQILLPAAIKAAKIDLMYFPGNFISLLSSVPAVVNIRATAHFYGHKYGITGSRKIIRSLLMPPSARKAKAIITPSEDIKRDVARFTKVSPAKITVIPHGVDTSLFNGEMNRHDAEGLTILRSYDIEPQQYLLYVSALWQYKNQDKLIQAFAKLAPKYSGLKLVLAGKGTGLDPNYVTKIKALPAELGIANKVIFTDGLPQSSLRYLYAHAKAFIFPSSYESFGNPIFESWASGIPIAASNVHSFPEIVGDAGLLFDPLNSAQFINTLERIITDEPLRNSLIEAGNARIKNFTWEACVTRTLTLLEGVMAK